MEKERRNYTIGVEIKLDAEDKETAIDAVKMALSDLPDELVAEVVFADITRRTMVLKKGDIEY